MIDRQKRPEMAQTRQSLLIRLKNWEDVESWQAFFNNYWRLIYSTGIQAGLSAEESEDVVQETVLSVSKQMPKFDYDKEKGSFRSWLLTVTHCRIADRFRKRRGEANHVSMEAVMKNGDDYSSFGLPELLSRSELEEIWDREWDSNLLEAAIDNVKRTVAPKHYQVFDLLHFKELPVVEVSKKLKVSRASAYIIRHRVSKAIVSELKRIQEEVI